MRIFFETVAGTASGSSAGTAMCAVMTESTPCSMAARKGTSSTAFEALTVGCQWREPHVRVDGGIAVAGEVLDSRSRRASDGSDCARPR